MNKITKPKATYENLKVFEALIKEYRECTNNDCEALSELGARAQEYYAQFDWFCYSFEESGKVGLKDVFGRVVAPAKYDEILSFPTYEYMTVIPIEAKKDGKIGILRLFSDREAQEITDFEYEDSYAIEFSLYTAVRKPGSDKWGLIDFNGKMVVPAEMDRIYRSCANGNIFVSKDGKEGVYDCVYEGFAYPEYDSIEGMGDGGPLIFVKDGVEGYVDVNGTFYSCETYERFCDGENYDVDGSLIFEGNGDEDEPLLLADHLD